MSEPANGPTLNYRRLFDAVYAVFIFTGIFAAFRPSPYDFLFILVFPLWFFGGGFRFPASVFFILSLWIIFLIFGFAALMPYWDQAAHHWDTATPRFYQLQSLYIICTVFFFTLFFSEYSIERAELTLKAYAFGAVVSAILGYLDIGGVGLALSRDEGRASATFDDPNLYGSYLVLGAIYVLQGLLLGTTKRPILSVVTLAILIFGVFASLSRGSTGALVGSALLMAVAGFVTVRSSRSRRRIAMIAAVTFALGFGAVLVLLGKPNTRELLVERAQLTESYDVGATGRFGNQARSIPMLLERPLGFGPLRFRDYFEAEPHNSYIGAFANDGWFGGFTWIIIVVSTFFVGLRLMFARSPYQRLAQVFSPVLFSWLLQGFQIDIDHWRQLFLCFGAVWGLEAARLRWLATQKPTSSAVAFDEEDLCRAAPMP
jgi:O-antigen ligase